MSGQGTCRVRIEVIVPQEKLVRVLVIDDDQEFLTEMQEFFSSNSCSVDSASSLDDAEKILKENHYEIVIADVNFDKFSVVKGDRFVLKNQKLFGKAKVVVVTGEGLSEERYNLLKQKGIDFLEKGEDNFSEELEEFAKKKVEERKNDIAELVQQTVNTSLGHCSETATVAVDTTSASQSSPEPLSLLMSELKQMLIEWLGTRDEPDEQLLAFGQHVYSANEMIDHIENETDIGLEHVRMLVGEIKYSLELDKDESGHHVAPEDYIQGNTSEVNKDESKEV